MKTNYELDNQTGVNHEGKTPNQPTVRLSATTINSASVKNTDGENLGDIKDLMLNLNTGTVEYAILEFGTFLGMGGKLFAIPFRELKASTDKDGFILDRDKQYLKDSPGFDSTHWPDTNDHSYFTSVDTYYDVVPPFP